MGYTHYWRQPKPFTDENWSEFINEVRAIFDSSEVPLANGLGEEGTEPLIEADRVLFNGVGDDAHETCVITKDAEDFSFCKTAYKPYDPIVVLVLKTARKYNRSIKLSSDGGPEVFN